MKSTRDDKHPAIGRRLLVANVGLIAFYCLVQMICDYCSVHFYLGGRAGFLYGRLLSEIGGLLHRLLLWSAVPVTLYANWRFMTIKHPLKRIFIGCGLECLVLAAACVPFYLIMIEFHLAIGGSL